MLRLKKISNLSSEKEKDYQIKPLFSFLKDEASVKYHVEKNDYFGTIATILSLIYQELKNAKIENRKEDKKEEKELLKTLKNLEKDLVFLQNNYQIYIKPKIKNKKIMPKGRLKSQWSKNINKISGNKSDQAKASLDDRRQRAIKKVKKKKRANKPDSDQSSKKELWTGW